MTESDIVVSDLHLLFIIIKLTVKSCADPNPVANGIYSPSTGPYTEYDEVTYTCNTGYYLLTGDALITCIDKAWINDNTGDVPIVPTCLGKISGTSIIHELNT